MPHINVKIYPGRTEDQKKALTHKMVQAAMDTVNATESSISVSFEEIPKEKWEKEVYKAEILEKEKTLYKRPGYKF